MFKKVCKCTCIKKFKQNTRVERKEKPLLLHLLSLQLPSPETPTVIISRPFSYTFIYINMLFAFCINKIIPYVLACRLTFCTQHIWGSPCDGAHLDPPPILPFLQAARYFAGRISHILFTHFPVMNIGNVLGMDFFL